MRRFLVSFVTTLAAVASTAPAAWAVHGPGASSTASSGFPWHDVLLWGGIAVGIVLVVGWTVMEARRHHWHVPHRPVHA